MTEKDNTMVHEEVINTLWKHRHLKCHRKTIMAVLRVLKARREIRRQSSKK